MRTLIALLLGVWLTGTLLLGGVAAENFFMIDRLLQSPAHPVFQKQVAELPQGEARAMLRYVSSELNRYYFLMWGWIEFVLGMIILVLAVRGLNQRKFTIGFSVMLGLVMVMLFYITPQITRVGRELDFVPRQPPPPALAWFGMLHGAYSILDLLKLVIGMWMAVALVRSAPVRKLRA